MNFDLVSWFSSIVSQTELAKRFNLGYKCYGFEAEGLELDKDEYEAIQNKRFDDLISRMSFDRQLLLIETCLNCLFYYDLETNEEPVFPYMEIIDCFVKKYLDIQVFMKTYRLLFNKEVDMLTKLIRAIMWFLTMETPDVIFKRKSMVSFVNEKNITEELARFKRTMPFTRINYENVFLLLRIFSRITKAIKLFEDEVSLSALVDVYDRESDKPSLLKQLSAVLANLICNNKCRMLVNKYKVPSKIIDCFMKFRNLSDVSAEMCAVLANLSSSEENANIIVQKGMIPAVFEMIEMYPENEDLLLQGVSVLVNCLRSADLIRFESNFSKLLDNIHTRFVNGIEVAIPYCNLVASITSSRLNIDATTRNVIFKDILKIVEIARDEASITGAYFCVSHMIVSRYLNHQQLLENNFIQTILTGVKHFPSSQSVIGTAFYAINAIMSIHEGRVFLTQLAEQNVVDVVISAMVGAQTITSPSNYFSKNRIYSLRIGTRADDVSENFPQHIMVDVFGSTILYNMRLINSCKLEMDKKGAIHCLFHAFTRTIPYKELNIVIAHILNKFFDKDTSVDSPQAALLKSQHLPSLKEAAFLSALNNNSIADYLNVLPEVLNSQIPNHEPCENCAKNVVDWSAYRVYVCPTIHQLTRFSDINHDQFIFTYCSEKCARKQQPTTEVLQMVDRVFPLKSNETGQPIDLDKMSEYD
ncbi:hypothetical protein ROZALSC1DRAFT_28403 [Rozella allomycis CSF55]|uniref:Uncharacterized protein n=1 Tax=Rozella allomycis (strain CSF55) TaxID=988480 RepID=A0A075AXJ3_ROZAC|nr:hypothetical protein O9G_001697 [Rozella allomycis CSF55]RKP20067.1 hypothetical protein ROZALSC1DRAFT_28403 [Rozella allomycis CSF55]|eukprot:EPZ34967.1 hypothetical protein O9G_001697 [Rozella allomycis CSF55]